MTRTEAPKDLGGRLRLNCARTTPELPAVPNVNLWSDGCGMATAYHVAL